MPSSTPSYLGAYLNKRSIKVIGGEVRYIVPGQGIIHQRSKREYVKLGMELPSKIHVTLQMTTVATGSDTSALGGLDYILVIMLGDTKVTKYCEAVIVDEDVLRLDVQMQPMIVVNRIQSDGHRLHHPLISTSSGIGPLEDNASSNVPLS